MHIDHFNGEDPFNPYVNARVAHDLYVERSGWGAWPNC